MTRNQTGPHSPWLRWSALVVTALLAASCGSGDDDAGGDTGAGGDYGGDTSTPSESAEPVTLEEFSIDANTLCRELLTTTVGEDPESYAEAAAQLEALEAPDDDIATGLVTAMRDYVTAHDAVLSRVEEIPGFDSPPGRWFLLENGEIYVSSTGQAADMEESGLPASVGSEFVDAAEALSDAAWRAEAPNCEGVETPPE